MLKFKDKMLSQLQHNIEMSLMILCHYAIIFCRLIALCLDLLQVLEVPQMKIAICEDEMYWVDVLKASVLNWARAKGVTPYVDSFLDPQSLIKRVLLTPDFDLLLLDISFGKEVIDGMAVADYLIRAGSKIPVIFVTADGLRADEGYLVEAKGYLKKPIDERKLALFLDRLLDSKKPDKILEINTGGNVVNIRYSDIVYVEVLNKIIKCHTLNNVFEYRDTFSNVLKQLGNEEFIQVHKSFLVRKDKIYSVKPTYPTAVTLIKGGDMVEVAMSRNYVTTVLDTYSNDVMRKML